MAFTATQEQATITEAAQNAVKGNIYVVQARAGTGKTTTAREIALANPTARILYMAFNKSTQIEADQKMPRNVQSRTSHSLAWRGFGSEYKHRMPKPIGRANRVPMWLAAKSLKVSGLKINGTTLEATDVMRLALDAVLHFCQSADEKISARHIWRQNGLEDFHGELVAAILPVAHKAWADIKATSGTLNVTGENYLKMWSLSRPRLNFDIIIYDEAQDANACVASVVQAQTHAVIWALGDSAQSINEWMGAIDSLAKFAALDNCGGVFPLTQSFRFGNAIADKGNEWLAILGVEENTFMRGLDSIPSTIETLADARAILCRTNAAKVIGVAMREIKAGRKVAIVGGSKVIVELAEAARDLQNGKRTRHPDLAAFKSWGEVQDYAAEDEGMDLRPLVKIIDDFGPDTIIENMSSLPNENSADVIVSTVHKAKGREWDTVRIHTDWPMPKSVEEGGTGEIAPAIMRLAYVAATRAIKILDPAGLDILAEAHAA